MEEANALDLVFPQRALDEAPRIVELGLDGDMGLREFLLVLQAKDLDGTDTEERVSVCNSECIARSRVAAA